MKNLRRTSSLILGVLTLVAFTLASCQKEEIRLEHSAHNKVEPELEILKLTNSQITQNKGITEKLNFFTETLKTRQQNKTVYSSEHDFYINTDFATYIEKANGSHSYTFAVQYLEETGEINNLVLHSKEDGAYDAIYLSYDVTENEKALINQGIPVNLEGKVSIAKINDATFIDSLFSKVTTYEECLLADYSVGPCDAGSTYYHDKEPFSDGNGMCSGSVLTLVSVNYDMDCINNMDNNTSGDGDNSAGDTGNPNGNPNDYTTNNGTTSNNSSDSEDDPITTPVVCDGCPDVEEDCSDIPPPAELISMMNTVFGEGNYEIGCPDPSGDMGITTIEELQVVKDAIFGNHEATLVEDDVADNQGTKIARFLFSSFLVDFNIIIKQQLGTDYVDFSDYSIEKVTSSADLITITTPFHSLELTYSQMDFAHSMNSYVSTVEIYSNSRVKGNVLGYGIDVGGAVYFNCKMNATDGSKISGYMNEEE